MRFDAREPPRPPTSGRCLEAAGGPVDLVRVAVGALGDQGPTRTSAARTLDVVNVNYAWPIAALSALRGRLVAQGTGRILVIWSVAGVRTRRVNYLYGGAKAGLDATCLGLAEILRGTGWSWLLLLLGFVRSKMTEGRTEAPFTTDVDAVADAAVAGLAGRATRLAEPRAAALRVRAADPPPSRVAAAPRLSYATRGPRVHRGRVAREHRGEPDRARARSPGSARPGSVPVTTVRPRRSG